MTRTYSEIVSSLLAIPKFGSGAGLHRMRWLCRDLSQSPWGSGLDAIKVTGSNGKGSVCAMSTAILQALNLEVGTYISPHLRRFNERISIGGQPIADQDLDEALDWFLSQQTEYARLYPADTIGAFEAFTAIALHYYARRQPHALVAEAGIGGRFDSTRVIPGHVVALTSLDLEHTNLLGNTLEQIAYDKADLCPDGGTLVIGHIDADVLRRLTAYCELRHITPIAFDEMCQLHTTEFGDNAMIIDIEIEGTRFRDLKIGLQGHHQVSNAAVAVLLTRQWLNRHYPQLPKEQFIEAVYTGLARAQNTGRFQKISVNPDIFIDVGHSPDAVDYLVETVRSVIDDRPVLLVTGVSYNKEVEQIVWRLLSVANTVICTRAYHKGSPVADIAAIVRKYRSDLPTFEANTIEQALTLARDLALKRDMTVLVAGGLFLAIEAMQTLAGENPQDLRFF